MLRRGIAGRSNEPRIAPISRLILPRGVEIDQHHAAVLLLYHIGGLNVAVNDRRLHRMELLQNIAQLQDNLRHTRLRQCALCLQYLLQGSARNVLLNNGERPRCAPARLPRRVIVLRIRVVFKEGVDSRDAPDRMPLQLPIHGGIVNLQVLADTDCSGSDLLHQRDAMLPMKLCDPAVG